MPSVRVLQRALVLAAVCAAACKGATTVKQLLDDPHHYDGKTVRIMGTVKGSAGLLGVGAYQINDGTGTISVVSEGGGAPRDGAKIGVEGVFHSAFTLGSKTGVVLVERRRYEP
jgi:hypothetical protein